MTSSFDGAVPFELSEAIDPYGVVDNPDGCILDDHRGDDDVDGCDHRQCCLKLIDWKTDVTAAEGDDPGHDTEGTSPVWRSVERSTKVVIGLTVRGELNAVAAETLDDSFLVIVLCTVESLPVGHRLTADRHLPTVVDSKPVTGSTLLPGRSLGCLISVGDRSFQLACSFYVSSTSKGIPPKPPRRHHGSVHSTSTSVALPSSSSHLSGRGLTNTMTNTELANYAASLVSSQLLMTSLAPLGNISRDWRPPSGVHIDLLYKSFREATNVQQNVTLFRDFVARCRHAGTSSSISNLFSPTKTVNSKKDEITKAPEDVGMADHVIEVLTDLVRNTVDPIEHVVLWLELLGDFARLPVSSIAKSFVRHRTTAVVLGCMTAHARCTAAQRHACHFLTRLVSNWPSGLSLQLQGVKENAIELIADIMKRFGDDIETVRAAVTSLAALTSFLSRYIETTIDSQSESLDDIDRQNVVRAVNVLDCIYATTYQTVVEFSRTYGVDDQDIRDQTNTVVSFYSNSSVVQLSSSSVPLRCSSNLSGPLHRLLQQPRCSMTKCNAVTNLEADVCDAAAPVAGGGFRSDTRLEELVVPPSQGEVDRQLPEYEADSAFTCLNRKGVNTGDLPSRPDIASDKRHASSKFDREDNGEFYQTTDSFGSKTIDEDDTVDGKQTSETAMTADQLLHSVLSSSCLSGGRSHAGGCVANRVDNWPSSAARIAVAAAAPAHPSRGIGRHSSLKAAVRSLLPVATGNARMRRRQSEVRPRIDNLIEDFLPPNAQPPTAPAVLGVEFRRSTSVQHFVASNDCDGRRGSDVSIGADDSDKPISSSPAFESTEWETIPLSAPNPDVTAVDLPGQAGARRSEKAPDLIQQQADRRWSDDDGITSQSVQASTASSSGNKSTLRRVVSFGGRPFWSKLNRK